MTCAICEKIKERKAHVVYEDDLVMGVMPSKPASFGHIKILPRNHFTKLDEMPLDVVNRLFTIANFASAVVFDTLKAHGTNIILNEGQDHLAVEVIPRKDKDGLNFLWKPKEMDPKDFDEIFSKIKDNAFLMPSFKESSKPAQAEAKAEPVNIKPNEKGSNKDEIETNYQIRHLTKIP